MKRATRQGEIILQVIRSAGRPLTPLEIHKRATTEAAFAAMSVEALKELLGKNRQLKGGTKGELWRAIRGAAKRDFPRGLKPKRVNLARSSMSKSLQDE